jgi:protein ImuA
MQDTVPCVDLGLPEGASKRERLQALERRIAEIEQRPVTLSEEPAHRQDAKAPWQVGIGAVDDALPQGQLDRHGLHDITVETVRLWPCAIGFGLALLGRLRQAGTQGAILWCQSRRMAQESGRLYGHGLTGFGLDPASLLFVSAAKEKDVLWAMEEGLRARSLAAVVGETDGVDFTASRRLALAAAENRIPAVLLRLPRSAGEASAAATRWRIGAHPMATDPWDEKMPLHPRWRVELMRCRGGRPGAWIVEWNHATHRFSLAAGLADRAVQSRCRIQDNLPLQSQAG